MPEYRLVIPSELEGFTVRRAAMGGLGMSGGQFKRAKFHGSVLLNGQPRAGGRARACGRRPRSGCAR